jgi:hypothetical protein
MEDTKMRKNLASLSAALAAGVLMLSTASSWANDSPKPLPQAMPVTSAPAIAVETPPAPIRLAWDRVGITSLGFGA